MVKGREDPDAYSFYCHFFLPYVVGRSKWNYMMRTQIKIQVVAQPSDEALGLLLLENSWDRWTWEHGKTKDEIKEDAKKKEPECPKTKYTIGRGRKDLRRSCSGWTNQGIRRFGELAIMTNNQRKEEIKMQHEHPTGRGVGFDWYFHEKVDDYINTTGTEEDSEANMKQYAEEPIEAYVEL